MGLLAQDSGKIPRHLLVDANGKLLVTSTLTDGTTNVNVNPSANALYMSSAQHSRIAKSIEFTGCHRFLDVANGASIYLLGKVHSTKNAHGDFIVDSEGKAYIEMYEAPTITADGTVVPIISINRQVLGTPVSTLFHTPTLTDDGTRIHCSMVGAGQRVQGAGGTMAGGSYFLFKKSQNYTLKVTNQSGAAIDINVAYSWHEE